MAEMDGGWGETERKKPAGVRRADVPTVPWAQGLTVRSTWFQATAQPENTCSSGRGSTPEHLRPTSDGLQLFLAPAAAELLFFHLGKATAPPCHAAGGPESCQPEETLSYAYPPRLPPAPSAQQQEGAKPLSR